MKRNPWTTLETREIYRSNWIRLSERDVLTPAGNPGLYSLVHFQNVAVGVLAIDEKDRVLMVGQFRYALDEYSWEIPEGGAPLGTSTRATAKRELKEETGYKAKKWKRVLKMHLSNSSTDERAELFLAEGLTPGEAEPEETEVLKTKWMPLTQAIRQVHQGKITDAITVAALLYAQQLPRFRELNEKSGQRDRRNRKGSGKKKVR